MAEFPALPLWTDAYLGDTTHLTTLEHGAYLLLLMAAWRSRDCVLPDDDKLLARYARCTPAQWARIRPVIMSFFSLSENGFRQARLTDEYVRVRQVRDSQSSNGRSSALKRKGRHSTERSTEREPSVNQISTDLQPSVNQASTERQPKSNQASTPISTPTSTLSKDSGDAVDSDVQFWADAKAFIKPEAKGDPGAIVGRWVREYGKIETANAVTRAQLERPVQRIPFIEGALKAAKRDRSGDPILPDFA